MIKRMRGKKSCEAFYFTRTKKQTKIFKKKSRLIREMNFICMCVHTYKN